MSITFKYITPSDGHGALPMVNLEEDTHAVGPWCAFHGLLRWAVQIDAAVREPFLGSWKSHSAVVVVDDTKKRDRQTQQQKWMWKTRTGSHVTLACFDEAEEGAPPDSVGLDNRWPN